MRRLTLIALCIVARGGGAADCPPPPGVIVLGASDCNANGIPDECDLATTSFGFAMDWFAEVGATVAVAAADLDRDGWPDVAAALDESEEIAVLLGEGGAFPVTSYFPVSRRPGSLRLADLDGDGDVDAAAGTPEGVSLLWNDGAGGLENEVFLPVGQGAPAVHAADLDRDGDTDLLTLNQSLDGGPSNVSVLSNEGGGRFAAARHYAAGDAPLALALADLDGDGDPDAAVVDGRPRIRILENDGAGDLGRSTTTALRFSPADVAAGAFDDDGNVDICLSRDGGATVLLGAGGGALDELPPVGTLRDFFRMRGMVTADLDGSGSLDVALLGSGTVLVNDGQGALEIAGTAGPLGSSGDAADLDRNGDMDIITARWSGVGFHFRRPVVRSADCNANGIPDECEADCNSNGVADDCDLASGAHEDCNGNSIPDECDLDCDLNRVPDECDIARGTLGDCNRNLVPDPCEPPAADLNANGIPDDCEISSGAAADCNSNGVPDEVDVEPSYGLRGVATSGETHARIMAVSDVDGDGNLDLLARTSDAIVLFRDLGRGGLRSATVIGPGHGPVAAGDMDGDGDIDISLDRGGRRGPGSRTELAVLLQESGAFAEGTAVTLPFRASSPVAADFDGDGRTDICLSSRGGLHLLRGLGGGPLDRPEPVSALSGILTAADLDGDGDHDLTVEEFMGETCRVLINGGERRFSEAASLTTGAGGIVIRDIDGDGDLDLASGGGHLYRNDGRAGFSSWATFVGQQGGYHKDGQAVGAGDVDADGDLDLLLLHGGALWTHRNDGAAGFRAALDGVQLGVWPWEFRSADIDGDGFSDLIGDGAWLLLNFGDPLSYGRHIESYPDRTRVWGVPCALDLDRDGDLDLIVSLNGDKAALHENRGAGSFAQPSFLDLEGTGGPIAAADLDGDGDEDVALGDPDSPRANFLWNDGLLTPRAGGALDVAGTVTLLAAADLDGDGRADVATGTGYHLVDVTLLFGEGDGGFASSRLPASRPPVFISPIDGDGDGDLDLALGRYEDDREAGPEGVSFLVNEGERLFAPGGDIALSGRPTAGGAGDFDGDGKVDLAVGVVIEESCFIDSCNTGGGISLLINAGRGRFREVFEPAPVSASIEPGDLDGDGDLDLLLGGYPFLNDGAGVMEPTASFFGGMLAGDLDGDGLPDMVEVWQGSLTIAYGRFASASPDQDRDGVPDECGAARFRRGDADGGGGIGLTDAVFLLEHLFRGGPAAACEKASDANDDGRVDITDPVAILEHLFRGAPAPPAPHGACGLDPTADALACEAHSPCA